MGNAQEHPALAAHAVTRVVALPDCASVTPIMTRLTTPVRGLLALAFLTLCLSVPSAAQNSPHGEIKYPCESCHSADAWNDPSTGSKFNHALTGFSLNGQHEQVSCKQCHASLVYHATSAECADCHTDIHRNELGHACERCHTPQSWLVPDMAQRHRETRFQLVGPHQTLPCQACHKNQQKYEYVHLPIDCYGCHRGTYLATTSPPHSSSGLSTDCEQCHSQTSFTWGGSFNHDLTAFPLTGAHRSLPCSQCHTTNTFRGTPTACYSCHQQQYAATQNPKHSPGFPTDCTMCHSTTAWRPASFDHNRTLFPLTGAHSGVPCNECHKNGQYAGTPTQCSACHSGQYTSATNPKHSPGLPTDCASCHSTTAWRPSTFDHNKTAFPLTGAHLARVCGDCHANGQYAGTPAQCNGCHLTQYNASVNPKHAPGMSTDCATCHSTTAWRPSSFNHSTTSFPLSGAHLARVCGDCHVNGQYAGTPAQCVGCHLTQYNTSVNPKHPPGMSTDCVSCHSTTAWKPSSFNHSTTSFPLTGAHLAQVCGSCHVNGQYAGTANTCVGCHLPDYNATVNPKHSPGFPTDCASCHSTTAWSPASFDHNKTAFPLTGAHLARACTDCHINGQYTGTPTQCVACHQQVYNTSTNPRHSPGLPTDCVSCHTTSAWRPSTFNHGTTPFALTGAHTTATCGQCHLNGIYAGTTTVCSGCHLQDYNASVNPNHAAAGFPTDCATCHNTTAWKPSTYNHDTYFPISAGSSHPPGRWSTCADCHTVSTNFAVFSCITCHDHAQSLMDPKHQGVSGYKYNSADCYRCHPTGRSGG